MVRPVLSSLTALLVLAAPCALCQQEANHITLAGTPICDPCWRKAGLVGQPEGQQVVPLLPHRPRSEKMAPALLLVEAPPMGARHCGKEHAPFWRDEPQIGQRLCKQCYPFDYSIRPVRVCPICKQDAWKERAENNGGGWLCGYCH